MATSRGKAWAAWPLAAFTLGLLLLSGCTGARLASTTASAPGAGGVSGSAGTATASSTPAGTGAVATAGGPTPSPTATPGTPPGTWGRPPAPPAPSSAPPLAWPQPTDAVGTPVVYLTFDDGPSPDNTPAVLSALQRYGAHATFFVVGQRAWLHPELVRQEVAAGHAVGGHGWRHVRLTELTEAERRADLGGTEALLQYLGASARCFRPPYGVTDTVVRATARDLGLRQYLWTYETKDWTKGTGDVIAAKAIAALQPGAILVFHDGHRSGGAESVTVVEEVLREIARRGWVAAALPC